MKQYRWFNILTIVSAAIFLIFLVVKSLSIDLEKHQNYQTALAHQNERKAIINQELLKSRYELFFSYDPLVNHLSELKETQAKLTEIPKFIEGKNREDFQQILAKSSQLIENTEQLLEDFKSQNSAFKNSLRYLPSLVSEIANKNYSQINNQNLSASLDELVQNILLYNLTSSEDLTSSVKRTIKKLQQIKQENINIDREELFLIDLANRHAEIILSYKPRIDRLTQEILALLNTQQSEELNKAYYSYYQKAINKTSIYRHFAYAWSLILLGWISYLAISRTLQLLQKSQRAELALQKMNEDLEAKVKERTAQLSDLWAQECLSEKKQRRAKEKLQQRVRELGTEIASVSQGDLTIRATVTQDEIGTIAEFYNFTLENLRQIIVQVQIVVQKVVNNIKSNEIAIQKLSEDTNEQKEGIAVARENIKIIAKSIQMIAVKAARTEALVSPMIRTGEKGAILIDRTVEEMLSIQNTTDKTNEQIKLLKMCSQKTSQLTDVIDQITFQTNGVAVHSVNEEPRIREDAQNLSLLFDKSLRHTSKQANEEVEKLIAEIQAGIEEVILTINESIAETKNKTQLVQETRQNLNQIASMSTQIEQLVNEIALSASEQSQASETVSQILEKVTTIASQTAISATDVSTSFAKLLTATQQLQERVSQFKVN
ncbi:MAG: methyl-accepting chemotaxis protein [Xenococcaceae cyanobacterium MO_188.B32]|nr:methyl-accepting chemotaxis protein [Xenococcaceae cyanobacterium MO_188.B32]